MEEKVLEDNVKVRLVQSGLKELEEHGIRDFSLRRVALGAQVSCAAPYRHFKDKEELILSIIGHVREGWSLLAEEISSVYQDPAERVVGLSVAAVRFWIANGNFRSVLMSGQGEFDELRRREMLLFDTPIINAVESFSSTRGRTDAAELRFFVLSLIYGAVTLASVGTESVENVIEKMKVRVRIELNLI